MGGDSPWCDNWDLNPVSNGAGWVVTGHTTACTTLGTTIATYLFVHKADEADDRSNMVLRYFETGRTGGPRVAWRGQNEAVIEVANIGPITKRVGQVDSVRVTLLVSP
jgi:hypothetical protein